MGIIREPMATSESQTKPALFRLVLMVVAWSIVLTSVALISARTFEVTSDSIDISFPRVWERWDSGYFLEIARQGYSLGGEETAFFPLYPLSIRILSLGNSALMPLAGWLISIICFITAIVLLGLQMSIEYGVQTAWTIILTIILFPTAFFFTAIYTESLFLLLSVLVYWFAFRKRYFLGAVCVALASLTRINGLFLFIIVAVHLIQDRPSNWLTKLILVGLIASTGIVYHSLYMWSTQGNPFAFLIAQQNWIRKITLPWQTILNTFRVAIGVTYTDNWFMRVVSLQDLLAALLFIICTVLAYFWVQRSLFIYMVAVMLFLLISHGPYDFGLWSFSRFVIVLFPGFVVLGNLLQKMGRPKYLVWLLTGSMLVFLTGWFAVGKWVG